MIDFAIVKTSGAALFVASFVAKAAELALLVNQNNPNAEADTADLRAVRLAEGYLQNRQDVSAFALTYSLRLRSCKSMDAFVIS